MSASRLIAIAATVSFTALSMAQTTSNPRQAWIHKDQRIQLLPQGAVTDNGDMLSRLMIQEAFARFGIAYDEGRSDVLASLFTEDAVLEMADGKGLPFQRTVGREAVLKQFASAWTQQADQRRHLISNVVIEKLSASDAKALAYGVVTVATDGLFLGASVIYSADLRRGADGFWRFAQLFIGMDTYVGKKPKT